MNFQKLAVAPVGINHDHEHAAAAFLVIYILMALVFFMELFVYNPSGQATVDLRTRYSVAGCASQHCGGPSGTGHGFVGMHNALLRVVAWALLQ